METDGVVGQNLSSDWNLAELGPWQDDGQSEDDNEPERPSVDEGVSERFTDEAVVIGKENKLRREGLSNR